MDVLPAIPNEEPRPYAILLTDTQLFRWQKSNPKLYADWFYSRMKVVAEREKRRLAEAGTIYKSIEEVPEWKVRTPLQRAVQILKRHRDIYFAEDPENCPVSIILTTLAAHAYDNQSNIYDAIVGMVRDMPEHIKNRDGKWWVPNPVKPGENFADKWNEKPKKREAFLLWLDIVQKDFQKALASVTLKEARGSLEPALGWENPQEVSKSLNLLPPPTATNNPSPLISDIGNVKHVQSLNLPIVQLHPAHISVNLFDIKTNKTQGELKEVNVRKGVSLKFQVITNTPKPYMVKWQVVNTGAEAKAASQLRGDFYDCNLDSERTRVESTAYSGVHWVEAFIIKDGICVARSGRKYVRVR